MIKNTKYWSLILAISVPILSLGYYISEQSGWLDCLTGRDKAIEGLQRLSTPSGYPKQFVYDDEKDRAIFKALEGRISQHTTSETIHALLRKWHKPTVICTAGLPVAIQGLPPEWPQEERFYLSENHPIFYGFNWTRKAGKGGAGGKACTLGDLSQWLEKERNDRRFILLYFLLSILSIAIIILRCFMETKQKKS